ncbi:hypothetical protein ASD62_18010 [Phycicoccus sp. Root563]|uniref:hypothetical protein n=1 Tax=Phycicoccus sp. Root563 TaxID=1736562 RepID=UPI000702408B|nr:hypothetical protein [Phycicoccus sp. Root563]KQZ87473.1 hypothetical protein ASD62_18010 [Phycicoccus sp. Root563]
MKITIVPVAAGLALATGIAITGASLASADQVTSSTATSSYPPSTGSGAAADPSRPMRSDEKLLTGDVAAKVTAAAKAKEPTAAIERVETDSDGVFEAHMVRADGTHVIVQIGKDYAVTAVQEGGQGGGPGGGPSAGQGAGGGAPTQGEAPAATSSSTT